MTKAEIIRLLHHWKPEIALTVSARFIQRGEDRPLTGQQYTVRLYDHDIFSEDDYLGHSQLDENGTALIQFYPADLSKHDWGLEKLPDLYLLLFKGDVVHFQSKVLDDVDFDTLTDFSMEEGKVLDFGTFLVD